MKIEDLKVGSLVSGLSGDVAVEVIAVEFVGPDAAKVVFQVPGGVLDKCLVYRDDEARLSIAEAGRPWSLDGDGGLFRLVSEAQRLRLAWLFDPFVAISSSTIEPLPHQISAVYEEMLPRLPMRFLLADDPGAGKTIMAGLLIKEMIVRGDLQRCLIVAPGSLTEQWQDELHEKFGLHFDLLTREMIQASGAESPFDRHACLIARMDQLSRNEDLQARLKSAREWDLVIVDEAHRMSASYTGGEVKRTKRYDLGRVIGSHCRNFLLMTATPHNGHEESFQLFLALIDTDRFEGKFRDGIHSQDPSDLMRRMIKEELVRFDGSPLFPERKSYTAQYELSLEEARLYTAVTDYVRNQMNLADRMAEGDGSRRVNVGFALMTLQRRLASSSRAIYRSLQRRRERLESRLSEERLALRGRQERLEAAEGLLEDLDDFYDETPQDEIDDLEDHLIDNSTAAQSLEELQAEIDILKLLEEQAKRVVHAGFDAKWNELQSILDDPLMVDEKGNRRKLVIFSEFRDTLAYLVDKVRSRIGRAEAVVEIHGGVTREERRKVVHAFMNDPEVQVLIANDAAGEGVNLQRAHLMVNYDLPWNPNRLEQRFGRIHRIGQTEVCHLWNLIAKDTREGDVYVKLLHKLEASAESLKGKVFDVLGQLFDQKPLRKLLEEAILNGKTPEAESKIRKVIDTVFDPENLRRVLERQALCHDAMDPSQVAAIRDQMIRAEARRLQPHFVEAFFREAFSHLGGAIHRREEGRYEITRVPQAIRDRDRQIGTGAPVLQRYERVCFEKAFADGPPRAELVGLGHPLLDATIDLVRERHGALLKQGAVLIDERDFGTTPRLLFSIDETITDGRRNRHGEAHVVSRRMRYVEVGETNEYQNAGAAPYLDYRSASETELGLLYEVLDAPWMKRDWEHEVTAWASAELVPKHLQEVKDLRGPAITKTMEEVRSRLTREIMHWDNRYNELREREQAGKKTALPAKQAATRRDNLTERLQAREAEIQRELEIRPGVPSILGGALVIPAGLLKSLQGQSANDPDDSADAEARKRVELAAMAAVMKAELDAGRQPEDVSAERGLGHDIVSRNPQDLEEVYLIEVKGRVKGAESVTLTANEIRCANNSDKFRLAIVQVEGDTQTKPVYVKNYDFGKPGFAQTSSTYPLHSLLKHASDSA